MAEGDADLRGKRRGKSLGMPLLQKKRTGEKRDFRRGTLPPQNRKGNLLSLEPEVDAKPTGRS